MARQLRLSLKQPPSWAREDFVVSPANEHGVRLLDAWPSWPGGALALVGPEGAGKTHLAMAWAQRTDAVTPAADAPVDLADLRGRTVLIENADRAIGEDSLFHLINLTQSGGGALLLVSRDPPAAWACDLPDLRSRLNAIRTVGVEAPDDAVLAAMLKRAFATRNITPGDEVIDYLARRIDRSADAVERIVDQLDAYHRPVTRVLARQVLGDSDEMSD